jgi:hypothetical protein
MNSKLHVQLQGYQKSIAIFFFFFSILLKIVLRPETVAQAYNPSYLEGGDWEDWGLRPAQPMFSWPNLNQ